MANKQSLSLKSLQEELEMLLTCVRLAVGRKNLQRKPMYNGLGAA